MTTQREIRILDGLHVEFRAEGEAKKPVLAGYAAVFDTETDIAGMFREKIARGAFSDALKSSDVHALFNHDENVVLGRAKAGTLRLSEDDHGLKVEIDPPDTQDARDLITKMERGDVDQMSFAFSMRDGIEIWDMTEEPPLRTIDQVGELFDVSVVTRGAYPTTEVAVRSLEQHKADLRKQQNSDAWRIRMRRKMDLGLRTRRA